MVLSPSPEGKGLIAVHSLVVEQLHDPVLVSPLEHVYADADGVITMCGRCRKSRVPGPVAVWNWVPAHLEGPRAIHYLLCAPCFNIYYPNMATHWST
ncbi:MAG TPA: hypothetical protein VGK29_03515 [Paludibaculum sp.]|jgi:hypothetical protein